MSGSIHCGVEVTESSTNKQHTLRAIIVPDSITLSQPKHNAGHVTQDNILPPQAQ
jgi:hypothetical protein